MSGRSIPGEAQRGDETALPEVLITHGGEHRYFVIERLLDSYRHCGFKVRYVGWDRLRSLDRRTDHRGMSCDYIMRGWGYASWSLVFGLPLWCLKLFWFYLLSNVETIHAVDFDAAFPAALAGLFRKKNVIYDIEDNFELRHAFPRSIKAALQLLSRWVARRSACILVSDRNRIAGGLEEFQQKIAVVPNCPVDRRTDHPRTPEPGKLVVAAFGMHLTSTRGVALLIAAAAKVPGVTILAAGRLVEPWLEERLRSSPQVQYLGVLPQDETLRLTCDTDLVFAFYDPSIEINRRASSAKWYDAMMAGRPVLSNQEIMNAPWIEQERFGFTCAYSETSLTAMLIWLRDHPDELVERGARARRLFESSFNRHAVDEVFGRAVRRAGGLSEAVTEDQQP